MSPYQVEEGSGYTEEDGHTDHRADPHDEATDEYADQEQHEDRRIDEPDGHPQITALLLLFFTFEEVGIAHDEIIDGTVQHARHYSSISLSCQPRDRTHVY